MRHLFLLLLAPLLLAACVDDPTSGTTSVIMPLEVGNQWVGKVTDQKSGAISYDTLTIVQEVVIDRETWYKANTGELFINRADGLWHKENESQSCACPIAVKYPASRGDRVMMPDAQILLPDNTEPVTQETGNEVMATDTSITVPAGTYSCYHYSHQIYSPANARLVFPYEKFYASDLGPVLLIEGGKQWELMSVTLK